jgi:RNA polymerase sigma-70 factor (ECF subfamily)
MTQRDTALVERLTRGETAAFTEFFDEYFPKLYRFARGRIGGDFAAAEDVAQAAICEGLKRIRSYRGEAALLTWLCTICRHEIHRLLQRPEWRARPVALREDDPEIRAALESLLLTGATVENVRAEIAQTVQATLDHLPDDYALALEWKYIEGRSVGEIAAQLRRSTKATESLLTRARESFREAFGLLYGEIPASGSPR